MNILITGAGSVMGQSIFKAIASHDFNEKILIHFANSDKLSAGRYFNYNCVAPIETPIFPLANDDEYNEFLEHYVQEKSIDIVFSGTQHELAKIALFRDKTGKAATITSKVAEICLDKISTSSVLSRYGVAVPKTQSWAEYSVGDAIEGAVIVKPNHSSSSRQIFSFENRNQALELELDEAFRGKEFLVQERLTGEEYTCGCYVDRFNKGVNTIVFKRTLTLDGATFYGEIIKNPQIDKYLIKVCRALQNEGLDYGHINIQLKLTNKGPVLFEINGRLSSTEASKAHYGFNSCAAYIYNCVRGEPYDKWEISERGKFLRYYEEVYFD